MKDRILKQEASVLPQGPGSANADPVARQCGSEVEESLRARKGLLKLISVDHSSYKYLTIGTKARLCFTFFC